MGWQPFARSALLRQAAARGGPEGAGDACGVAGRVGRERRRRATGPAASRPSTAADWPQARGEEVAKGRVERGASGGGRGRARSITASTRRWLGSWGARQEAAAQVAGPTPDVGPGAEGASGGLREGQRPGRVGRGVPWTRVGVQRS
ncbi:MAG TPA: hypothetical protein VKT82_12200 [Ktedonobacterales bacterium]|nr:hypothetical protein [Ktedonobacterales bacterium]